MTKEINKPGSKKWWIAYNQAKSIIHNGATKTNQVTTSGMDTFDTFETEDTYSTAADTLDIDLTEDDGDKE